MAECLFCRIVCKEIGSRTVFEDGECVAFEDINPQAPHHVLIVPRRHIATVNDLGPADGALVGHLALVAQALARARGVADYRLVLNCGPKAGQSVYHIHLHFLAGRAMAWPPG